MIYSKVTSKLSELDLDKLARQTKFIKRSSYKISPLGFLMSFFMMVKSGQNTLERWASELTTYLGEAIRVQSLNGKLQFRHIEFCKVLLNELLRRQLQQTGQCLGTCKLIKSFNRIWVEDSTCVALPKSLEACYPGSVNQNGQSALARLQLRIDLKTGSTQHIELQGYRDNDQKYASAILGVIQAGDLVLRDLGYWSLRVFKELIKKRAYFVSRCKFGVNFYSLDEQAKPIDLAAVLRQQRIQGKSSWEQELIIGKKEQVRLRVVAIRCSAQVEQKRKRKSKKDRRKKPSKAYMELLAWTIFVTNVEKEVYSADDLLKVYGYRWRIEIIFKCWKNRFKLVELFKPKHSMSPARVEITFYLVLVWITCFFVPCYDYFLVQLYRTKGKILSLLKFASFFKAKFDKLIELENPSQYLDNLAQYYCQSKRKKISYLESIYMFKLD